MSLIFLATVILNLAFSQTEKCENVCSKTLFCGMPMELAERLIHRGGQGGVIGVPVPYPVSVPYEGYRHHHPHGGYHQDFPFYGEEEEVTDHSRRLLAAQPGCKNSPFIFHNKCQQFRTCGSSIFQSVPETCAEIATAGLCSDPDLAKDCCFSCRNCEDATGGTVCPADWAGCQALIGSAQADCAATCDGLGFSDWCYDPSAGSCEDDDVAAKNRCESDPKFQMCGAQGTQAPHCLKAKQLGWCSMATTKNWMANACAAACGTCDTCATFDCGDGFTLRADQLTSVTVTKENCCIDDDKICSCEWQCMFNDDCCEDYEEECCK